MNILITSIGRRVELVELFKDARDDLNIDGKIITCDNSNTAPASYYSDKNYFVCRIDDEKYIDEIIDICNKENIALIVPTIDTELYKFSSNKEYIEKNTNAKVLISDVEVVNICRDKYKTYEFFLKNNFYVPRLINEDDIKSNNYSFPLFIKPLNGSSSINTFKINNKKELDFFIEYVPNPIIQEFIDGEEYTVDVFVDFEHNPVSIVPRKRIATRSGEVLKGITVKNRRLINEIRLMVEKLKPVGHITIQCIFHDDKFKFIEINPRFGGGAPISIKAGANSPKNLYKLLLGERLSYSENYEEGFLASRYDWSIFVKSNGDIIR